MCVFLRFFLPVVRCDLTNFNPKYCQRPCNHCYLFRHLMRTFISWMSFFVIRSVCSCTCERWMWICRRWISLVQHSEEMKMQFTGKDIVSAELQTMRRVIHTHIHKPYYHHAIFCRTRIVHGIRVWSMAMCSLHILVIISHLFISRQTWLVCHVRHISLYTESSGLIQMIHARTVYIVYHIEEAKQRIQE